MVMYMVLASVYPVGITPLVLPAPRVARRVAAGGPADGVAVACSLTPAGACPRVGVSPLGYSSAAAVVAWLGLAVWRGVWIDRHPFARASVWRCRAPAGPLFAMVWRRRSRVSLAAGFPCRFLGCSTCHPAPTAFPPRFTGTPLGLFRVPVPVGFISRWIGALLAPSGMSDRGARRG